MLSYKEFYIWLQGYLHGRLEDKNIDIAPIIQKMDLVKENNNINISEPFRVPIPVNPFPVKDYPYTPPWEVTCGTKEQLND